jgi:hypothetical protein
MNFDFKDEYQCCVGPLTAMISDFASVVSSPPPAIIVASKLIKNCLGSDSPSNLGIILNLYPIGH